MFLSPEEVVKLAIFLDTHPVRDFHKDGFDSSLDCNSFNFS